MNRDDLVSVESHDFRPSHGYLEGVIRGCESYHPATLMQIPLGTKESVGRNVGKYQSDSESWFWRYGS
jgi:hypothetical protein